VAGKTTTPSDPDSAGLRARLAAIVESSQDAILAKELDGTITAWNPGAERLYGYLAAEIVGRTVQTIIPPELIEENTFILGEVAAGRTVPPYDTERLTKAGERVRVSVAVSPVRDAAGTVIGASAIARDLSAARSAAQRERDGERREAALEQELGQSRRLESVGQLAGGIAHDFNNLLGVILNLAAFVVDEVPEDSPARADAEEIGLAARRAASLTRQLLIFSRRDTVAPEVFDAGELVESLGTFLRHALSERVELEVATGDELWLVKMDRGQLEQVVVNLAINARDAMPAGGRLIIETRNTVVDASFATTGLALTPGNYVTLAVSDTGTGMEPAVLEQALEPFFTTKAHGQGTGLGLSTVADIVAKAGGRVSLYSEPGHGTSIKIHIPASDAARTAAAVHRARPARGHGERILIVEDADDVRAITERILRTGGYTVAVAASAADAEAIVSAQRIDVVVTDVVMPVMTGTELVERLRTDRPALKVVFMSGYSNKLVTDDVLAHEYSGFIEKPFTANGLRRKVQELLARGPDAGPADGS
jgi:two-component system cell cycle sensor histidine kinase/response regulator CckA